MSLLSFTMITTFGFKMIPCNTAAQMASSQRMLGHLRKISNNEFSSEKF